MKKATLLFLFPAILFTGSAQIPSNCDVPDVLRIYYEPDVKSMALKWLYATKSPDTALIDIPQWSQDSVWSGLAAIFNRHDLPSVDSVFNKYCVHAWLDIWHSLIFRGIVVDIDTLYDWTHHWREYQITTGIASLDTLMAKYGFQVSHVYNWSNDPPTIGLYTNQYINAMAMCDSLRSFVGILSANPNGLGGSWTTPSTFDFSDTSGIKYYQVIFSEGGIGGYFWKFRIDPGCLIELVGSGFLGIYDSLPAPANCNILDFQQIEITDQGMKVYPNPSNGNFTVTFPFGSREIQIFNSLGQLICRKTLKKEMLSDLQIKRDGIYFVQVITKNQIFTKKLIVQK